MNQESILALRKEQPRAHPHTPFVKVKCINLSRIQLKVLYHMRGSSKHIVSGNKTYFISLVFIQFLDTTVVHVMVLTIYSRK